MSKILELIIGGSLGTCARYALAGAVYRVTGANFPYGTLAVNLSGCLLLGFLTTMAEKKFVLGSDVRTLLMIGFCGAFTTFSTFIFETEQSYKGRAGYEGVCKYGGEPRGWLYIVQDRDIDRRCHIDIKYQESKIKIARQNSKAFKIIVVNLNFDI